MISPSNNGHAFPSPTRPITKISNGHEIDKIPRVEAGNFGTSFSPHVSINFDLTQLSNNSYTNGNDTNVIPGIVLPESSQNVDAKHGEGLTLNEVKEIGRKRLGCFRCNWRGCRDIFVTAELLIRHVHVDHVHPTILENPKGAQTSRRPSSPSAADYKGKGIAKADDASGSPGTTGKSLKCSWGTCSLSEGSEFSLLSHVDSHIERAISSVCPFKDCPEPDQAQFSSHFIKRHLLKKPWTEQQLNPLPKPFKGQANHRAVLAPLPTDVTSYLISTPRVPGTRATPKPKPKPDYPLENPSIVRLRNPTSTSSVADVDSSNSILPKPPKLYQLSIPIVRNRSDPDIPFWPMCGDAYNIEFDSSSIFPSLADLDDQEGNDSATKSYVCESLVKVSERKYRLLLPSMVYPLDHFDRLRSERRKAEEAAKARGVVLTDWGARTRRASAVNSSANRKDRLESQLETERSLALKRLAIERDERFKRRKLKKGGGEIDLVGEGLSGVEVGVDEAMARGKMTEEKRDLKPETVCNGVIDLIHLPTPPPTGINSPASTSKSQSQLQSQSPPPLIPLSSTSTPTTNLSKASTPEVALAIPSMPPQRPLTLSERWTKDRIDQTIDELARRKYAGMKRFKLCSIRWEIRAELQQRMRDLECEPLDQLSVTSGSMKSESGSGSGSANDIDIMETMDNSL